MRLAVLAHEHRGPLVSDLHRYHNLRWVAIRQSGLTVFEVADFVGNLPPDSAIARATNPDWALTRDSLMLRDIEHDLRVLAWTRTTDAASRHPQNYPEPLPLLEAEIAKAKPEREFDVMTIDEANEFLGWSA